MLESMGDPRDKTRLKAAIDENLRKIYHSLAEEEVPDRFKQLLEELRKKEQGK
jgi:type IV secretory pathway VirB4 component